MLSIPDEVLMMKLPERLPEKEMQTVRELKFHAPNAVHISGMCFWGVEHLLQQRKGVAILICNTSNYVVTKYNGTHSLREPLNNEEND